MSLLVLVIAISLSMDAFSLSLAYGTLNIKKTDMYLLSIIVGVYHFFMPIIGMLFGRKILEIIRIDSSIIVFIVLLFIGIEMIVESKKSKGKVHLLSIIEMIIFGFAVSVDSFSIGIGLNSISNSIITSALIFSISSLIFTYIGLFLGKKVSCFIGKVATLLGGVLLIIIGLLYIL